MLTVTVRRGRIGEEQDAQAVVEPVFGDALDRVTNSGSRSGLGRGGGEHSDPCNEECANGAQRHM